MIITIDTSKDSHEDLRKLIKFLQHHVGEAVYSENSSTINDMPTPSAGMFDMFGDDNNNNNQTDNFSNAETLLRNEPNNNQDDDLDEPEEKISIMPY